MKYIFESNWVYLAHESQIPEANDYYTTYIGRQPVVVTRDKAGALHAVINACAHRGAMLCRRKHGNKGSFTCPFHGWTFSNTGKLLKVKDEKTTQYPPQFGKTAPTISSASRALRATGAFCSAASARMSLPLRIIWARQRSSSTRSWTRRPKARSAPGQFGLHL